MGRIHWCSKMEKNLKRKSSLEGSVEDSNCPLNNKGRCGYRSFVNHDWTSCNSRYYIECPSYVYFKGLLNSIGEKGVKKMFEYEDSLI